jgi:hypothetical protein
MCGAMVYMLLAAGAVTSAASTGVTMGGPAAAGRFPLLALVLAVFMVGYVMWQADRLPALAQASPLRTAPARTPALAASGRWRRPPPGVRAAPDPLAAGCCPPASRPAARSPWPSPWAMLILM